MSITLERFLPGKITEFYKLKVNGKLNDAYATSYFNQALTEASKVEIGLSREKLLETLHNAGFYKIIVEDRIIDALLAAESELIIKKINHPPQGRKEVNE